jgi:hypothetical protein
MKPLKQWEHERRRLPGAGLCAREHVPTREDEGDHLALDRSRVGVSLVGNRTKELGRKPEGVE